MMQSQIEEILKKIASVKIAVYGDFCLDCYWVMDPDASEVSIETGLMTETVRKQYYSPGGAANVVANISALKPELIRVIGTVGDDMHGRELTAQLQQAGADTSSLFIQQENFDTYTYLKRHFDGSEQPRIDFGSYNKRSNETETLLLTSIEKALQECDALIFNQQVTGSISNDSFIESVNALIARYPDKIVILDSRHFNSRINGTYLKANDREIAALVNKKFDDAVSLSDLKEWGRAIFNVKQKPVIVTCGDRGILSFDKNGDYHIPGIQLKGKLDTVGAGDTVISAVALCMAAGISVEQAATFANFAAAVTVQKRFTTGTANGDEILEVANDPDFVFNPDLAANERNAVYIINTEFE
ncbi:MAG TPA: PfkB family carbohydrate kinase, partial [Dyadobacter sp.]|nr:PfkB family carbohydrate kinase [Dyadobacter sp.]